MRENESSIADPVPRYAVITAIRGGVGTPRAALEGARGGPGRRTPEIHTPLALDEEMNDTSAITADRGGIMKSYRIEQSYS